MANDLFLYFSTTLLSLSRSVSDKVIRVELAQSVHSEGGKKINELNEESKSFPDFFYLLKERHTELIFTWYATMKHIPKE